MDDVTKKLFEESDQLLALSHAAEKRTDEAVAKYKKLIAKNKAKREGFKA